MRGLTPWAALATAAVLVGSLALQLLSGSPSGAASPANGQGSTYAGLAFQQWTQSTQSQGLSVNYTPTNSPAGLQAFAQNTADFAGTEAEFSEVTPGQTVTVPRGFEYTPDVAGATAIMYHVNLGSDSVNYLHLSPLTIAKIFLGKITNWDDPAITADNTASNLVLPHQKITVDCRSGQSGTTALFYDFVQHTDPTDYAAWAQQNGFSTAARVLEVDNAQVPSGMQCYSSSDLQAQAIASGSGLWSIGYDEFGYAKVYNDNVAWVKNAAGNWVQPYAVNISAALKSAQLAPDTSQDLSAVYTSADPQAYPISAYSYILVQCAPTPDRPTCKTPYTDPGIANTMAAFMSYVACAGQIHMADIGYAPLPPELSQFLANAIGWMKGQPAQTLTASNCSNPTFTGGLGQGATPPTDPTGAGTGGSGSVGGSGSGSGPGSSSGGGGAASGGGTTGTGDSGSGAAASGGGATGTGAAGAAGAGSTASSGAAGGNASASGPVATGKAGSPVKAVGGGSTDTRPVSPAAFTSSELPTASWVPLLGLLLVLAIPVVILSVRRRSTPPGPPTGGGP